MEIVSKHSQIQADLTWQFEYETQVSGATTQVFQSSTLVTCELEKKMNFIAPRVQVISQVRNTASIKKKSQT